MTAATTAAAQARMMGNRSPTMRYPNAFATTAVTTRPRAFHSGAARLLLNRRPQCPTAGDERAGGGDRPVGGGADDVGAVPVFAVAEQHRVTVGARLDRVRQRLRRDRVAVADPEDDGGEERIHWFPGALQFGVAALVQAGAEERVEQRALLRREPDVRPGHRRQPVGW